MVGTGEDPELWPVLQIQSRNGHGVGRSPWFGSFIDLE